MNLSGHDIQNKARQVASDLSATSSGYPFTEHLQVWKVAGKVFLIVTEEDPDLEIITVKVEPHHGDTLRREHRSISRGHYLDKDHWISIGTGADVTRGLVEDLVQDSYDLAQEQLPLKDRPPQHKDRPPQHNDRSI